MAGSVAATGAAVLPAGAGVRRRSTPERLIRMRRTLVVAIVLFDLTAALVLWLGQNAVRTVERRSAPGLLDALAVRAALADADQAAWASFLTGSAALVGPGAVFENDIATAGRHLEHLAELATTSSGELLTISGQLLTYQSLVERADASYRAGLAAGRQELAFAWLTAASKPLHESGGLLAGVDRLVTSSQETNDGQARSWWTGSAVLFLPLVAALSLLAGLVRSQLMFRRLFRRAVNPALAVAMALTVALSVWLGVVAVHTDRAFGDAQRRVLPALVGQWEGQIRSADEWSQAFQSWSPGIPIGVDTEGMLDPTQTAPDRIEAGLAAASATYGLGPGLPVLAVATLVLVLAGFYRHMKEYEGWRQ